MSTNINANLLLPHFLRTPNSIKETSKNCKLADFSTISYEVKVQVKQSLYIPVTGPEGSRRLRLPLFETIGT